MDFNRAREVVNEVKKEHPGIEKKLKRFQMLVGKKAREKERDLRIIVGLRENDKSELFVRAKLSDVKIVEDESTYTSSLAIYVGDKALAWFHGYDVRSIVIES